MNDWRVTRCLKKEKLFSLLIECMLVVCLVIIAYPYLKIMSLETFATAFVFFYIAVYGISITENLGQLGVPIPNWVKERLSKLQDTNTNPNVNSKSSEKDYGDGQEFTERKEK
ncbi:phage holin family protein [Enterococcus casseliflavus]|uniref:phage holin family protein n=1 Tax=Enterococcus casseliflavus TaxID=37734 RepID=UPI003D0EDC50